MHDGCAMHHSAADRTGFNAAVRSALAARWQVGIYRNVNGTSARKTPHLRLFASLKIFASLDFAMSALSP